MRLLQLLSKRGGGDLPAALLELEEIDLSVEPPVKVRQPGIVEHSHGQVASFLSWARSKRETLIAEIDERRETLRQTEVAIVAFEAAQARLVEALPAPPPEPSQPERTEA